MAIEIIVALAIGAIFLLLGLYAIKHFPTTQSLIQPTELPASGDDKKKDKTVAVPKGQKTTKPKYEQQKHAFKHPWLENTLKGPAGQLRDSLISSNDKFVVATSSDGSCMLWNLKTKDNSNNIRSYKIPVEADTPNKVSFSPDTKAVLFSLKMANKVRITKIGRKDDGSPGNFQHVTDIGEVSGADICSVAIASTGQFIMICYTDVLAIYTTKGVLLHKCDTGHNINYQAVISPCGRFVASCGFTPDVKVKEVSFTKSGDFKEVKKAFELKGHNAGVYSISYSADSSKIVSASKDGSWRLYNVSIDHSRGEDPHFLSQGRHPFKDQFLIALSSDGLSIAMAYHDNLLLYNASSGQLSMQLQGLFVGECVSLYYDSRSSYLFVAGDRQIYMFNNVAGFQARVEYWKEMKEKPIHSNNKAMRERCDTEIGEAELLLKKYAL